MKIPLKRKKYDLLDTQLNYLEGRLGILDIETQLNSLKVK